MCIRDSSNIPEYTIESDTNSNGVYIEKLNLCEVDNVDITTSQEYSEDYPYLPFVFPITIPFKT